MEFVVARENFVICKLCNFKLGQAMGNVACGDQ